MSVRVAELAREERPREKLLNRGPEALSDAELVALLLRTGTAGTDVLALAEKLLTDAGGLAGLAAADRRMILRAKGVGPAKGAVVAAALEVGRRLARLALQGQPLLDRPEAVAEYLARSYGSSRVERFGSITLDARNRLLQVHELHRGARSHADVEPSEVFNSAILDNAHALIVWHTHPSGDPAPSEDDVILTRRLADAGRLLNIAVLDHIVVGRSGFVSLRQRGVLAAR
ncbi:MAG TPA: DNA repair protein RadC [Thermoanaerobaculaceae bacterium]|nr:DNA repair protein RadC [Thermoanaerobaculaceae bacterium]